MNCCSSGWNNAPASRESRLGATWRTRTGLEVVRSFVNMLVQTERFGTPLSKSLGYFADSLRTRRRQQAEEMAAKTTDQACISIGVFHFPKYVYRVAGAGDPFDQQEFHVKFWAVNPRCGDRRSNG